MTLPELKEASNRLDRMARPAVALGVASFLCYLVVAIGSGFAEIGGTISSDTRRAIGLFSTWSFLILSLADFALFIKISIDEQATMRRSKATLESMTSAELEAEALSAKHWYRKFLRRELRRRANQGDEAAAELLRRTRELPVWARRKSID